MHAARARLAARRRGAPAAPRARRQARGDDRAGDGHLPLDVGHRHQAESTRGRQGRPPARWWRRCRPTAAWAWSPSPASVHVLNTPTDDRSVISGSLDALKISGGTAIGDAIAQSQKLVQADTRQGRTTPPAGGSDRAALGRLEHRGQDRPDRGRNRREEGRRPGLHRLARHRRRHDQGSRDRRHDLGRARPKALAAIAKAGGGQSYTARNAIQLKSVYSTSARRSGPSRSSRTSASASSGSRRCLLLGSTGLSLRWFRRAI